VFNALTLLYNLLDKRTISNISKRNRYSNNSVVNVGYNLVKWL